MIRKQSTKQLYESLGPAPFAREMLHYLGLVDRQGRRHQDHAGNGVLKDPTDSAGKPIGRFRPTEFSLRDLAEATIGEEWAAKLNPNMVQKAQLFEEVFPILEAGAGALAASQFANINAFTAVVAGLLEVSVLEGFQTPEFIADQLMPAEPTRMFEGRKVIGASRIGDRAEERLPGMPTTRINIGERWITQPRTVENALASEVSQEAVYLDLTGEVLQNASDVGTWLGYRKELRCIDAFIGVTNSYVYKGSAYNTYIAAGYFDNDFSNELLHWDNVQAVLIKFRDMKDPETNTRILTNPNTILVNAEKLIVARSIVGDLAGMVQYRDAPGATSDPQQVREFNSPYKGMFNILTSPLVYERCTAADGLNLSASNAGKYWWTFQKGKPFKYAQNWPLRVQQAAPNNLEMIDRGIVLYVKADERGIPMVYEPRLVVRSKN